MDAVEAREAAAHDQRNWVRLTYDCNDRCIFCLDSRAHDGEMRDPDEVKRQILDGRKAGATRLILSGGEPTIHPRFVDFVRLGRLAGYPRIQTVTNGRLFAYKDFLTRALDAGLTEITFSIHGPNAKIHDALVGVAGAFEQEVAGLEHALADGRPVINIDVCVNRGNVKQLPALIETFVAKGVREYDLLHVIPFGRAYTDGKEVLFYDLAEMQPYLQAAFAWARKPDMHVWLNRFPPAHCEGFEDLIQDPYKFNDEVRGRQEEYELLLERGQPLHCRSPEQCRHCYLEPLCDSLDAARATVAGRFEVLRVDATAEAARPAAFGGDPASAKRAATLAAAMAGDDDASGERADGKRRLPLLGHARRADRRSSWPATAAPAPSRSSRPTWRPHAPPPRRSPTCPSWRSSWPATPAWPPRWSTARSTAAGWCGRSPPTSPAPRTCWPSPPTSRWWCRCAGTPRRGSWPRPRRRRGWWCASPTTIGSAPTTATTSTYARSAPPSRPACRSRTCRRASSGARRGPSRPPPTPRCCAPTAGSRSSASPAASSPTTSTPRRCGAAAAARPRPVAACTSTPSAPTASRR
ncbi:MAG: radical SAM protein [Myxococcales bacterium]|nr:radical SAM protein [Myxococcales bacterium]